MKRQKLNNSKALITKNYKLKKKNFKRKKRNPNFWQPIPKSFFNEKKWASFEITGTNVTNTGAIILFGGLDVGETNQTRIGNKIVMRTLNIKYSITPGGSTALGMVGCISIIYDKQPNQTLPPIFTSLNTNNIYNGLKPQDLTDINNKGRYTVLMERQFSLTQMSETSGTSVNVDQVIGEQYLGSLQLPVEYNSSLGSTVIYYNHGALYFVARCSNSSVGYTVVADVQVSYEDK